MILITITLAQYVLKKKKLISIKKIFFQTDDVIKTNGNRIATVLFYVSCNLTLANLIIYLYFIFQLSDVEQGGATVFPEIEQAIFPRKGSAVLWYNLNTRGDGDPKTLHAACPVIVGSKWGWL